MKLDVRTIEGEVRATVANALASALICGIDECEENKRPLTQLQAIDLAKYSIMNFDEAVKTVDTMKHVAEIELRFGGGEAS